MNVLMERRFLCSISDMSKEDFLKNLTKLISQAYSLNAQISLPPPKLLETVSILDA